MMKMKKLAYIIAAALMLLPGCKKESIADYSSREQDFEAWIAAQKNVYKVYPDARRVGFGTYILKDEVIGTEDWDFNDKPCALVHYIREELDGDVLSTNIEDVAKRIGSYEKTAFYGVFAWPRLTSMEGIREGMEGMKIGGTRIIAVPAWLMTSEQKDSEKEYKKKETDTDACVYRITLVGAVNDVIQRQIDMLEDYSQKYMAGVDSTYYAGDEELGKRGFYFYSKLLPPDAEKPETSSSIKINYTARRIEDGGIFDTNVADTAIKYKIFDPDEDYSPVKVNLDEDWSKITMGDYESDLISGFKAGVFMMHKGESARFTFFSPLGYGNSGSYPYIPPYSPLCFDIDIVEE